MISRGTLFMNTIPVVVVIAALSIYRLIESFYFPVISGFVVSEVTSVEHAVIIKGTMIKARHCLFEYTQATGIFEGAARGRTARLPLKFLDNLADDRKDRAVGVQDWGPWMITIPIDPTTVAIDLTSSHSCHPLWSQKTHLASVPLIYVPEHQ